MKLPQNKKFSLKQMKKNPELSLEKRQNIFRSNSIMKQSRLEKGGFKHFLYINNKLIHKATMKHQSLASS
jgi:hypothetical protein